MAGDDHPGDDPPGDDPPGDDPTGDDHETRRVAVVVNPERSELGDELRDRLAGLRVELTQPESADDLGAAVDRFVADGFDVVAAVGGDGTQRTVAERLLGTDVALAVVPGGTVNLLGKVLGIDTIDDSVRAIVDGRDRHVDVGSIDGDVFVLNASSGWDAAVIERVDDHLKRFGRLGYTIAGIVEWFRSEPRPVRIEIDDDRWYDDEALTVLVMNVGQRGSASLRIAPDAEIDDGLLDVVVLRRRSIGGLARSVWATVRGRRAPSSDVRTAQAATVHVTWSERVPVQCDGDEIDPAAEVRCEAVRSGLRVVVPKGDDRAPAT